MSNTNVKQIIINESARLFATRFCNLTGDSNAERIFADENNSVHVKENATIVRLDNVCELTVTITAKEE